MNAMSFVPANVAAATTVAISDSISKVLAVKQRSLQLAISKLEQLENDRQAWEGQELESARRRLYSLLSECYGFYLTMKTHASADMRQQYKEALAAFIEARSLTTALKTSNDMSRIVRAVFGVDRRRVSVYSIALRKALESGGKDAYGNVRPLPASELANWLAEQGGVEEIRLGSKNSGATPKQRAEIAATALKDTVLMRIKPDARQMRFDTDDSDRRVLLVATYRPNGELEISAVVKSDSAVNAALAAHYNGDKEAVKAAAERATGAIEQGTALAMAAERLAEPVAEAA